MPTPLSLLSVVPRVSLLAVVFVFPRVSQAEVKPHALFSDHGVLQQGRTLPIWGTAEDGEKVTVRLAGHEATTEAKEGRWRVELPALEPGGPHTLIIEGPSNRVEAQDVLIGEVWIASGQSNMEWPLKATENAEQAAAQATDEKIRFFDVPNTVAAEPQENVEGRWVVLSPEAAPDFSAVAYYFARDLRRRFERPVGIISTNWGGTPAESWTSREKLGVVPELVNILQYDRKPDHPWYPGGLYNAMIHPLLPYAIRGAIWYQGESNADRAWQYRTLFPTMISNWREAWGQGDFPFLLVQLAPWVPNPSKDTWPELREAQLLATKVLPRVGMAVTTDVGDPKDIHPRKKEPVGARLALAARALAYGEQLVYSGPIYDYVLFDGREAKLTFRHAGSGLEAAEGDELIGFTIAGADRQFHPAKAKVTGTDTIVVTSDQVERPVAVRYGWADNPEVNLQNKEGLPASPFRTDDFPLGTRGNR